MEGLVTVLYNCLCHTVTEITLYTLIDCIVFVFVLCVDILYVQGTTEEQSAFAY